MIFPKPNCRGVRLRMSWVEKTEKLISGEGGTNIIISIRYQRRVCDEEEQ